MKEWFRRVDTVDRVDSVDRARLVYGRLSSTLSTRSTLSTSSFSDHRAVVAGQETQPQLVKRARRRSTQLAYKTNHGGTES